MSSIMVRVDDFQEQPELVRHQIFNIIRQYNEKFRDEFGEMVIAMDHTNVWRKKSFPYYKANRKKDRQKSNVDWYSLFNILTLVRTELKEHFPYKVLNVDGAEADDIIATLVHRYSDREDKILILSSDKDFMQLQKFDNVKQYSPIHKKFLKTDCPKDFLTEHIIKGDRGDGIPNVRSPDSTFVSDQRQKPINKRMIIQLTKNGLDCPDDQSEEIKRNWDRNKTLIDLSYVPNILQQKIVNEYQNYQMNDRNGLLNYFIHNKLNNLTEHIGEF